MFKKYFLPKTTSLTKIGNNMVCRRHQQFYSVYFIFVLEFYIQSDCQHKKWELRNTETKSSTPQQDHFKEKLRDALCNAHYAFLND